MFFKTATAFWIAFLFLNVRSQRIWGSSGYNAGFSNSWGSNSGLSNGPFGNGNSAVSWGSNAFGGRPNGQPPNQNWGFGSAASVDQTSGWNSNKPSKGSLESFGDLQTEAPKRPNEKKSSQIMNQPNSSKWNTNTNTFLSENEKNVVPSSWGSNSRPFSGQSNSGNAKPGNWFSNNNGNKPNENEILSESDDEDNSMYSWSSNKKKKTEATNGISGDSKWETNNKKKTETPSDSSNSWNSLQPEREKNPTSGNEQNDRKQSTLDTSILDELDKNDWYFGKESDYPKPPFQSTLNIDVSKLWNFDKNRNPNEKQSNSNNSNNSNNNNNNNRGNNNNSNRESYNKNNNNRESYNTNNNNSGTNNNININNNRGNNNRESNYINNNNNNRGSNSNNNNRSNKGNNNNRGSNNSRRNRGIEGMEGVERMERIQCECVNVNFCEEEDMIVTQEDIKFDLRPLEEFRCEKLTDVCCTKPKVQFRSRSNFNVEQLQCGQRRHVENPFNDLDESIAAPGEFPWNLRLENSEMNCSASLIHHNVALTAAHCVTGALPGELSLKAGVWNSNDEPSQRRKVMKIIPHPDYNSRKPRNDIALLILETPFELTDNVNTICLPVTNDKWDSNDCVLAGWNRQEIRGQVLDVLEKGAVNFLPQQECQNIMLVTDLWRDYVLHDSFVCGLEKTGRESCTGDEGGFVACPSKKRPGSYLQIGIVSEGMNCDAFGRPGIFTNILPFLDWINKNYFELQLYDDIDIRSLSA